MIIRRTLALKLKNVQRLINTRQISQITDLAERFKPSYKLLSINAASCDLETAPTFVASTLPFLKIINVGIPRMPNLGGVAGFSSMFNLVIFSLPAYSSAISSRIGAIILHGPHQSAQ